MTSLMPLPVITPVVVTIETPTLGDRSYLVHDGDVAFVVDPQRDVDRVLDAAAQAAVTITHVFETHIHNDYVTGGFTLAEVTGAAYLVNAEDEVAFSRTGIRPGDVVDVSPHMRLRVIATPGHTFTHLAFALEAVAADGAWAGVAVFTGGSMLFGAAGRPDLLGHRHTESLVHHQYASVRRLAGALPDEARVLPTHGFGSFCAAGATVSADASTIGDERRLNPAMTQSEAEWVEETLAGLDAFPAYYAHMGPANAAGPSAVDLTPPSVADRETIARRIALGEWVVDLRTRTAFADGHVTGSLNFGLDGQFATYLGWLIPWGAPVTLLGESEEQVAQAQRELVRIGIDKLAGRATGGPSDWTDGELATVARATFADLAHVLHHRRVHVVDVRRTLEFRAGHVDGALHLPLHDLLRRLDEVPRGEVWLHCGSGYRASIAASLLAARGVGVIAVDDVFDAAGAAGLPIVSS